MISANVSNFDELQLLSEMKKWISYNPTTGEILWIKYKAGSRNKIGDPAGYLNGDGYRVIVFNYKKWRAQNIAWLFHYGEMPNCIIDHIDLNPLNNRISNLRKATKAQNSMNTGLKKNSTTGYKGVSVSKSTGKFKSYIKINREQISLGSYLNAIDAAKAYDRAAFKLYGEFCKLNFDYPNGIEDIIINKIPISEKKTSKYRGVRIVNDKILAGISINGKSVHIGTFRSEEEAAIAYDNVAKEKYGIRANLNFN